ncbi:MAG: AMP-binding protein [SAR324 cluster bacterium]|nr:AMP-binding protein [SAR324 cluster bacterium]
MNIREIGFFERLEELARSQPETTALVCEGKQLKYRELPEIIRRLLNGMHEEGIETGERIALLMDNCNEYLLLIAVGFRLGSISVCINTRTGIDEMKKVVEQTTPSFLIYEEKYQEEAEQLKEAFPKGTICINPTNPETSSLSMWFEASSSEPEIPSPSTNEGAIIIPTAAVGGIPKGALLSQNNLLASVTAHLIHFGEESMSGLLSLLPPYHVMGLCSSWTTLLSGGKVFLQKQFDADEAVKIVDLEKLTYFGSFPPILERFLDAAKTLNTKLDSLKLVYGLEGPQNIERLENETSAHFLTGFGQAETSEFITYCRASDYPGSAGIPSLLNRVELFDDAGNLVPTGSEGEIAVKGPNVFLGYWNMPEETAYAHRNGWHHTGDIGRFGDDGRLYYVKRKAEKELIKTGGENVYPGEVESVLLTHPNILSCCVIGVPDPTWGESVLAVCKLDQDKELTQEEVREYVGSKIAGFKKPRNVIFVEELPIKNGETDRESVKEIFGS